MKRASSPSLDRLTARPAPTALVAGVRKYSSMAVGSTDASAIAELAAAAEWAGEHFPVGSSVKFTLVAQQGTPDDRFLSRLSKWEERVAERFFGGKVVSFPEHHRDGRLHAEVLVHVPRFNRLYQEGCQALGLNYLDRLSEILCRDWDRLVHGGKHGQVGRKVYDGGGIEYAIKGLKGTRSSRPPSSRVTKLDLARQALADLRQGVLQDWHIRAYIAEGVFSQWTWLNAVKEIGGRGKGLSRVRGARGRFSRPAR